MNLQEKLIQLRSSYDIIEVVNLDQWHDMKSFKRESWLRNKLQSLHQDAFKTNQRIVFSMIASDEYESDSEVAGVILKNLIYSLNAVDITNFFVILITNAPDIENIKSWIRGHSSDTTEITIEPVEDILKQRIVTTRPVGYQYNSSVPIKISVDDLTDHESFLLRESKTFCMYPWIHLHAYPTGEAYPCCHAEMTVGAVGNCRENTLEEIWNSDKQKQLRKDMLNETFNSTCNRCYEQENNGFFLEEKSANKHHGHHITRVQETKQTGM
jgi:radical SAM protein with 4Fe4S-binding SPASM domain